MVKVPPLAVTPLASCASSRASLVVLGGVHSHGEKPAHRAPGHSSKVPQSPSSRALARQAAKEGSIEIGDHIVEINGVSTGSLTRTLTPTLALTLTQDLLPLPLAPPLPLPAPNPNPKLNQAWRPAPSTGPSPRSCPPTPTRPSR
jgi:hypothetical protein